jgi:subtilase family serine protease
MKSIAAKSIFAFLFIVVTALLPASAQQAANVTVTVKNHTFQPAQIHAPANVPINLRVKNLDSTAMEFESDTLHVEKVVNGKSEAVIQIKPQAPGRYEFYDDYHQESTGVLVVR